MNEKEIESIKRALLDFERKIDKKISSKKAEIRRLEKEIAQLELEKRGRIVNAGIFDSIRDFD